MIRAVIFDCFGVLYQGSLDYLYDLAPVEHKQALVDLARASDFGYIDHDDYLTQMAELLGSSAKEVAAIISARHVRHADMFELVRSLRARYKVGLLSNVGQGVIEHLFTPHELEELFDATVLSYDVGAIKPYPEAYQLIASRLGCMPNDCVMIDDMAKNIDGAVNAGMRGILYQSATQVKTELSALVEATV